MNRHLMIVSASWGIRGPVAEAVPAIERYDGVFMRILRKYIHEGYIDQRDILVVSPTLGVVRALTPVPYHEPIEGDWHDPKLDKGGLEEMNQAALLLLKRIIESGEYSEVYVNVGKKLRQIIAGIDMLPCKIVYAKGKGLGPKAAHMKEWILQGKAKQAPRGPSGKLVR